MEPETNWYYGLNTQYQPAPTPALTFTHSSPDMSEEKERVEIDERKLLRKIDMHLLPVLPLLLLLSFLDQSNSELLSCLTLLPPTHLFQSAMPASRAYSLTYI